MCFSRKHQKQQHYQKLIASETRYRKEAWKPIFKDDSPPSHEFLWPSKKSRKFLALYGPGNTHRIPYERDEFPSESNFVEENVQFS
jgi:hypothetical protein